MCDDQDVRLAGIECEIELPGGTLHRATTDAQGVVRIEGSADPGQCVVRTIGGDFIAA